MGLTVRTIDDGRVNVLDVNLDSEPATGIANLITGTNRYENGDKIEFDSSSRTEVIDKNILEKYVEYEIKEIIDYAEFGYTVKKQNGEKKNIEISEINSS